MKDLAGWSVVTATYKVRTYMCIIWCRNNLPDHVWQYESRIDRFSFKYEIDAAAFKLTFEL